MSDTETNKIFISSIDNKIYLMPKGHITANLCFPLRTHLYKKISDSNNKFEIYIDLSHVSYMDSTFMGLLVGLEKKLIRFFKSHLHILNACDDAKKFLSQMNLESFLHFDKQTIPKDLNFIIFNNEIDIDELEKTKIVLDSHKNLSSLHEKNKSKFSLLEKVLKDKIKKIKNIKD